MSVYNDNLYSSSRYDIKDQSEGGTFVYQYRLINNYYSLKLKKVLFENEILNENITRVYKNTGLINSTTLLLFMDIYDTDDLNNISKDIYKDIIKNINIINDNLDLNLGNTITNYLNKVPVNKELFLFINANYK